jgi:hypothetical protein
MINQTQGLIPSNYTVELRVNPELQLILYVLLILLFILVALKFFK